MRVKEQIKKTTNKVKDEAKGAVEYVKISYRQKQVSDAINYLYKKLGEVRYNELKNNEGITEQSMKIYDQIALLIEESEQLAKQKAKEKDSGEEKEEKSETIRCSNCSKKLPKNISYCPYCGQKCVVEE